MRVLICGDRNWNDKESIGKTIDSLEKKPTTIIHGGAKGADSLGAECASERGIPIIKFPAEWTKYGKSAGYVRNQQMLHEGKPNLVIAFNDNIINSKGTKMMMELARKSNITVLLYTHKTHKAILWHEVQSKSKGFF